MIDKKHIYECITRESANTESTEAEEKECKSRGRRSNKEEKEKLEEGGAIRKNGGMWKENE